jgi:PAS domain S-box-containing protein
MRDGAISRIDRSTLKVLAICSLLIVGYWIVDSVYEYSQYNRNLRFLLFQEPLSLWDCLALNIPPRAMFDRTSFIVATLVGGFLFSRLLRQYNLRDRALGESEKKYRGLVDLSFDGILVESEDGSVLDCNPAGCQMFGYTREEMIRLRFCDLVLEESASTAPDGDLASNNQAAERTGKRKDGTRFPMEVCTRHFPAKGCRSRIAYVRDISERKQAEESQRLNQSRLETLVALGQMTDATVQEIADFTLEEAVRLTRSRIGYLAFVDDAETTLTMYSWSRQAMAECAMTEKPRIYPMETVGLWGEPLRRRQPVITNDYAAPDPHKHGYPEGHVQVERHLGVPVFDGERIVAIAGVGNKAWDYDELDVQQMRLLFQGMWQMIERRRSEERVQYARAENETILNLVPAGVLYKDRHNRIVRCNRGAAESIGKGIEEVEGRSLDELMPDEAEKMHWDDQEIFRTGQALFGVEEPWTSAEGKIWVRADKIPYRDENGEIVGVLIFARDITQARRDEALRQRLSTAIEQADEYVAITDAEGYIEYVNPAFERMTGYRRGEVTGRNIRAFQEASSNPEALHGMWIFLRSGRAWSGSLRNRCKDGSLIEVEATISPIRDGAGHVTGFVAVKRDVTRELKLERQLRQSQKMEAIGQLAGGVAHDFNNILQVIRGYNEIVLEAMPPEDANRPHLEEVLRASHRASTLVRQLLVFSRCDRIERKTLSMNQIIGDLLNMLRRVLGEQVALLFQSQAGLWSVSADSRTGRAGSHDLCVNARDAMPEGGQITIETANVSLNDSFIELHPWARPGDFVRFSVTDTGAGIPPEIQDHIFEPFFTTKAPGRGTGLGLATVYGIVQGHDGLIEVVNDPPRGASFRIYFPRVGSLETPEDKPVQKPAAEGGNETILLAEDDDLVRRMNVRVLESAGYRVLVAEDGVRAMDLFREHRDRIDLVFLDVVMPRKSGPVVCREIQAIRPEVPILFTTGYSFQALETELLPEGRMQVLQKPCSPGELLAKVRDVLSMKPAVAS